MRTFARSSAQHDISAGVLSRGKFTVAKLSACNCKLMEVVWTVLQLTKIQSLSCLTGGSILAAEAGKVATDGRSPEY